MGVPDTTFNTKPANNQVSPQDAPGGTNPETKSLFFEVETFPVGCNLPGFVSMITALGNHSQSFQPPNQKARSRRPLSLLFPRSHPSTLSHPWPLTLCVTFSSHGSGAQPARSCGLSYPSAPKAPATAPRRRRLPFAEPPIKDVPRALTAVFIIIELLQIQKDSLGHYDKPNGV